jgi:hypothetical protein
MNVALVASIKPAQRRSRPHRRLIVRSKTALNSLKLLTAQLVIISDISILA